MTKKGTAVITGGSSGIGAGFAKAFARKGYNLLLVARDQGELQKLTDSLKDMHPGIAVSFMRYDLSKMHDIRELENRIAGMSDLDILVNCAGFGINKEFVDENIEKREDMVMVHDIAAMRLTYEAIGAMKKRGRGSIINVSSVAAFIALGNNPIYAASKAFLDSFSQNLYRTYRKDGIYIQSLCPGFTATNFAKRGGYEFKGRYMKTKDVVNASLSCMRLRRRICIPGWKNKLFLKVYRMIPRSRAEKIFERLRH